MRSMQYPGGQINLYHDDLGKPSLTVGNYHIPLVKADHKSASNIRIHQGYALAVQALFNFKSAIVKPYLQDGKIVFPRFNGQIAFELKVAGNE